MKIEVESAEHIVGDGGYPLLVLSLWADGKGPYEAEFMSEQKLLRYDIAVFWADELEDIVPAVDYEHEGVTATIAPAIKDPVVAELVREFIVACNSDDYVTGPVAIPNPDS